MTRLALAGALVLGASLASAGCGKYGPPERIAPVETRASQPPGSEESEPPPGEDRPAGDGWADRPDPEIPEAPAP